MSMYINIYQKTWNNKNILDVLRLDDGITDDDNLIFINDINVIQMLQYTFQRYDYAAALVPWFQAVWPTVDIELLLPPEMIIHIASFISNHEFTSKQLEEICRFSRTLDCTKSLREYAQILYQEYSTRFYKSYLDESSRKKREILYSEITE